ncbi:MAG TPA: low molecular weight protein-tyrosine-phosphatase [Luteimonas sp.]|nr:low molecular weight protein-tyrosine-phosphatase [Luteimonas sp.]
MTDVLFVCLGNICRSPLMEGIARSRWQEQAAALPMSFDSAGIGGWHAGAPPDARAVATARRHGIDISAQRARKFVAADFQRFDLILCADRSNLEVLQQRRPKNSRAECALFLDWSGARQDGEVPDPYTGDERAFESVYTLIDLAATGMFQRLQRL